MILLHLLIITQNEEAKAVLRNIESFEETMALLKRLALGNLQIKEEKVLPAAQFIKKLRSDKGCHCSND